MSSAADRPQAGDILVLVGTRKGTFLFWSDPTRRAWRRSQHHGHAGVNVVSYDERDGSIYAATSNFEGGPAIQRSRDRGLTWQCATALPALPTGGKSIRSGRSRPGMRRGRGRSGLVRARPDSSAPPMAGPPGQVSPG